MKNSLLMALSIIAILVSSARAQFEVNWSTLDGGGTMSSTGGQFALAGTIGQSDANPANTMVGGQFTLTGGFWAAAVPMDVCGCPGDMNHDCITNGQDVQDFVNCMFGGQFCASADMDGSGAADFTDVAPFVTQVLASESCP